MEDAGRIEMYLIDVVLCSWCFGDLGRDCRGSGKSGEYIALKGWKLDRVWKVQVIVVVADGGGL